MPKEKDKTSVEELNQTIRSVDGNTPEGETLQNVAGITQNQLAPQTVDPKKRPAIPSEITAGELKKYQDAYNWLKKNRAEMEEFKEKRSELERLSSYQQQIKEFEETVVSLQKAQVEKRISK